MQRPVLVYFFQIGIGYHSDLAFCRSGGRLMLQENSKDYIKFIKAAYDVEDLK